MFNLPNRSHSGIETQHFPQPVERPRSINRIETYLGEGNYQEALSELFFQLQNPEELDFEKTYKYLFHLIPHMNEANLCTLLNRLKGLPNRHTLLSLTSHLPTHQYQLALILGDSQLRREAHLEAMEYYAKAIKIAKHMNDKGLQKEAHSKASKLLLRATKSLNAESYKEKFSKARRMGNAEEFDDLLEEIKELSELFSDNEYIDNLFKQARDVLNEKEAKGDFLPLIKKITVERDALSAQGKTLITERYQQELINFRGFFATLTDADDVRLFQAAVTRKMREFFSVFLKDAYAILGKPPSLFDIRAVGSIGREEACPFSDLEFFVLIENEEDREYFITLIKFLEIQVISLGETAGKELVFSSIGQKNESGFHIDSGSNPVHHSDLMGTPQKMASLHKYLPDETADFPTVCCNQILNSISFLNEGNSKLFEEYRLKKSEIMNNGNIIPLRQVRAIQLLETSVSDFQKTWQDSVHLPNTIHIKNNFVQFLNFVLGHLALYCGIEKTNTVDIIDSLVEQKICSMYTGQQFKAAVTYIYRLRVRLHQFYGEQNEEAYLQGPSGYILLKSEKEELEKIYRHLISPFFCIILPDILKSLKPFKTINTQYDYFINSHLGNVCSWKRERKKTGNFNLLPRIAPCFSIGTLQGNETLQANFNEMKDGNNFNLGLQTILLKSLSLDAQRPISITLQHCDVLNTKTLEPLLHQGIEFLDVRYSPQIKNKDVASIQTKCTQLMELYLTGCEKLTAIDAQKYIQNDPMIFSRLKVIHLDQCPNLKFINILSPCLIRINAEKNPQLKQLDIVSCLRVWESTLDCPKLLPEKKKIKPLSGDRWGTIAAENWNDKDFVLEAIHINLYAIKFVSELLQNDKDVIEAYEQELEDECDSYMTFYYY